MILRRIRNKKFWDFVFFARVLERYEFRQLAGSIDIDGGSTEKKLNPMQRGECAAPSLCGSQKCGNDGAIEKERHRRRFH
jgi:hypothetical protein